MAVLMFDGGDGPGCARQGKGKSGGYDAGHAPALFKPHIKLLSPPTDSHDSLPQSSTHPLPHSNMLVHTC